MATNATLNSLFYHQGEADGLQLLCMNGNCTLGGLAIKAGSSAIAKFVNTLTYQIDGKLYTKTAADLPLPVVTVANGYQTVVAWFLDASGNITSAYTTPAVSGAAAVLPAFSDTVACIGAAKIVNASGSNFVGATTALDKTGITVTYYNLGTAFPGMTV